MQQDGPNRGRLFDRQRVGSVIRKPLPRLLFLYPIHCGLKLFVDILFFKGVPFFSLSRRACSFCFTHSSQC
jgi:hypothetical protein